MTHLLERTCAATCSTLKRTPELVQLASMENLFFFAGTKPACRFRNFILLQLEATNLIKALWPYASARYNRVDRMIDWSSDFKKY